MIIKPSSLGDYFNSLLFGGWDKKSIKKEAENMKNMKSHQSGGEKGKRSEKDEKRKLRSECLLELHRAPDPHVSAPHIFLFLLNFNCARLA